MQSDFRSRCYRPHCRDLGFEKEEYLYGPVVSLRAFEALRNRRLGRVMVAQRLSVLPDFDTEVASLLRASNSEDYAYVWFSLLLNICMLVDWILAFFVFFLCYFHLFHPKLVDMLVHLNPWWWYLIHQIDEILSSILFFVYYLVVLFLFRNINAIVIFHRSLFLFLFSTFCD